LLLGTTGSCAADFVTAAAGLEGLTSVYSISNAIFNIYVMIGFGALG
jgi:hypothetical protein